MHPETPPDGLSMSSLFPAQRLDAMWQSLKAMGAPYGIQFGESGGLLSNTRKALQAGEYARAQGKFEQFHNKVFYAYFVEGRDIGDLQVILEIGYEVGLDVAKMQEVLTTGEYLTVLEKARADWLKHGTTGIPTFIINENTVVIGARTIEEFRQVLAK